MVPPSYGPDEGPTTSIELCVSSIDPEFSPSGPNRLFPSSSKMNTDPGSISSSNEVSMSSHEIVLLSTTTPGTNPREGPSEQYTLSPGVNPVPMTLTVPSLFSVTVVSSGVSTYWYSVGGASGFSAKSSLIPTSRFTNPGALAGAVHRYSSFAIHSPATHPIVPKRHIMSCISEK